MHRIPVIVVHGGAGRVGPERREAHLSICRNAARGGLAVLESGGCALDAVQKAVEMMEDDPGLNAGIGSALTSNEDIELDACLMDGHGMRAGAVCALPPFAHPIHIARAALEDGRHVLYAGAGAASFARSRGFSPVPLEALRTEAAVTRLRELEAGKTWTGGDTVGAVACDGAGHLAAATSTGGTMGKRPGRVGDSPIPGAGTYADDRFGAASATGDGEAILRAGLTRTCVEHLRRGSNASEAARQALAEMESHFGGRGGLIVVTPSGETAAVWNTETMCHAVARPGTPVEAGC